MLLTEASSSWATNLPGPAQDSFLHTIFTVAELGQYAAAGVSMVARWSFMEMSPFATLRRAWNATAQRHDFVPAADYWLLLAHKATVGGGVLGVLQPQAGADPALVYAYCGKHGNGNAVIAAANPSPGEVTLRLDLGGRGPEYTNALARREFVFTAPGGNLSSQSPVLNNGHTGLRLDEDGALPASFAPATVTAGSGTPIVLPPTSSGYFELVGAAVPACLRGAGVDI